MLMCFVFVYMVMSAYRRYIIMMMTSGGVPNHCVPGDHLNNGVVHMRVQRNAKKGLFFEAKRDLRKSRWGGSKCAYF